MIMRIPSFENDIVFSENYISVLHIQNGTLFARIIGSINSLINGVEELNEKIIFIDEDEKIMKASKDIMLITDIWNFDFNQKKIQSALFQKIEKIYQQEYERLSDFQTHFQSLQINAMDVWEDLPFEFEYKDSIGVQEYLKLLGLKIAMGDRDSIFGFIKNIKEFEAMKLEGKKIGVIGGGAVGLDVVEYFGIAKLVVFTNLKLYLSQKELEEVYKYIMYKKVMVLLLETGDEKECVKNEKILFVDSDYDEIMMYNN